MEETVINYAIVALTIDQVDDVLTFLKDQKDMSDLINWINLNKKDLYKESPNKWTPFKSMDIQTIIGQKNEKCYFSGTSFVLNLLNDFSNIHTLSDIRVFFVDALSMYTSKYEKLASRIDFACCDGERKSCCFIMNDSLPPAVKEILKNKYKETWPAVSYKRSEGCMNRMIDEEGELRNFIIQLRDKVNPFFINPHVNSLDERFGTYLFVPKNY